MSCRSGAAAATACVVSLVVSFVLIVALFRPAAPANAPVIPSLSPPPSGSPPPSLPPPVASATPRQPKPMPDYRLKWLGAAADAVSVSGDWNGWTTPGVPMLRDEGGSWAADIYLPPGCPRQHLILTGVCCYHYKFFIETGKRRRWLHDPRQPMDKDPDGWVNNFLCKYASGPDGRPLPMLPHNMHGKGKGKGKGDGGTAMPDADSPPLTMAAAAVVAAEAAAARASGASSAAATDVATTVPPPPPPVEVCFVLPATYFNGSAIGSTSTRGLGGCCEMCRRKLGCVAYNWRPEPLPRNCVLFGRKHGVPRGTALSSAGIVRVPLGGAAPAHSEWSWLLGAGSSTGGDGGGASAPPPLPDRPSRPPAGKRRKTKRRKKSAKRAPRVDGA